MLRAGGKTYFYLGDKLIDIEQLKFNIRKTSSGDVHEAITALSKLSVIAQDLAKGYTEHSCNDATRWYNQLRKYW